ncbi:unnamed protein product (macronuclear) [Paramecium tetraurelia]|uniref:Uncharacterized protein n=1 Tax=Paramecium tetraurelia TaxID=5888 RepID=A0CGL0_PARTE|nr:uncharacterized protein GSPATT00007367001 [Paramecium tetraurelia]CAK69927.1 unnamed protein product [Paramecium tetraurelia]|eukprot:XP_001437324.1 hypothetical protein (macronuclear) [Paramecium tetraurelia strain d4-2]
MQQLSAYALLQEFEKQRDLEILSIKNEFQKVSTYILEVHANESNMNNSALLKNSFFQDHLLTENSFLQIINKGVVDTQIATMGSPLAPTLNEHNLKSQDDVYKFIVRKLDNTFIVQEIRHNSFTASVSYCDILKSFIISSSGQTIICEDRNDVSKYNQIKGFERACKVAISFFDAYHKMNHNQQINFANDLIHRSLVGCRNKQNIIEWYSIMEHYNSQRMLPPYVVNNFLNHYNLETAKSYEQQTTLKNFPQIYDSIYNELIDQYHDYFKGKTIYFWKDDKYLGNCYIPSKHFEVLRQIKIYVNNQNSNFFEDNPPKFLSQYNLNQQEYKFYFKCIKLMFSIPFNARVDYSFINLSTTVFNCVHKRITRIPKRQDYQYTLAQCLQTKTTIAVLIPVGINGMGYGKICQTIMATYEGVKIVSKIDQVNDNHQLYLFDQVCSLKQLKQTHDSLKKLPYEIRSIALYPECSHGYLSENQFRFPFSFKFIMFCLLSVLDHRDQVNQIIKQLKEFENQRLKNLPSDYQIGCHYIPESKETNDLYSEIVEQDFKAAFSFNNEQLIESLSLYKDSVGNISQTHFLDQARNIINVVEEKVQICLTRKPQQLQNKTNKKYNREYGLFIQNPNWDDIDNFILDGLEIILKQYPKDSNVNLMYQQLETQLFKKSNLQTYFKENNPYMLSRKTDKKHWHAQVEVVVIVVDGIVILYPEDLGLNQIQDIPIYSSKIEVTKSNRIAKLVKRDVEKLYDKKIKEETFSELEIKIDYSMWKVFLVKLKPIKINLVEDLVD